MQISTPELHFSANHGVSPYSIVAVIVAGRYRRAGFAQPASTKLTDTLKIRMQADCDITQQQQQQQQAALCDPDSNIKPRARVLTYTMAGKGSTRYIV